MRQRPHAPTQNRQMPDEKWALSGPRHALGAADVVTEAQTKNRVENEMDGEK